MSENWTGSREESLFDAAMQLPTPEARAAFLREACAGDDQLRQRVEALLQAAQPTNDFLEKPAGPSPADLGPRTTDHGPAPAQHSSGPTINLSAESLPVSEKPGDKIGHYKLLEQIGEGGCGVVYMAEQTEPIRRRVAFKVIKLGMDTKSVVARFEAERQALALMDHPNIAKVLDAGATDTGRPYFVMELVRGIKITDYCDQHSRNTKQRLDLFMQVCHAIQHAHQKGIIHRDIKPSNILVTLHDGVPVPKVIDFGIAKATQQPLTDKTLFTAFQQFIGTPAYMSPEQAELSGLDIDTRSDIYALGVLLYELLTGGVPFEQKELLAASFDEMRRIIREQEPPKPSTRLATTLAANPHSALRTSQLKEVRGDLDWIVMKCLEKDRSRRYETATGLAQDVKRHLENEPVTAAAPGALYRVRKFIRRHRTGLATATVLVLLLLVGVTASVSQAVRAAKAELQASTVATVLNYMMDGMRHEIALGRDTTVLGEIMDQAVVRMRTELKDQPEVQAGLWANIANGYSILGDYSKAEEIMRAALATAKQLHRGEHTAVADALDGLAGMLAQNAKLEDAEKMCREALAMRRKLLGSNHEDVVASLDAIASMLVKQGRHAEAESLFRKSLAADKKRMGAQDLSVATDLRNIACTLEGQGRLVEAEDMFRDALAMRKKLLDPEDLQIVNSLRELASLLSRHGKFADAEELYTEAVDRSRKAAEQNDAKAQCYLGFCYDHGQGVATNHVEAVKWYRKAAEQNDAAAQCWLGACYQNGLGIVTNHVEAVNWYDKAAKQNDATAQFNLGCCYQYGQGVATNYVEAVKWYHKAAKQNVADAQRHLGFCYANGQGVATNHVEAVKWFHQAADQNDAWAQNKLGLCYNRGQGVATNYVEAAKWYRKAAEQNDAWGQNNLGVCYRDGRGVATNYVEAVKWLRKAAEQNNAWAQAHLGGCYATGQGVTKDEVEAVKWFSKAAEQNDAWIQNSLAWILATSANQVIRDGARAVVLAEKAVAATNRKAPYNLGTLAAAYAEVGQFEKAVSAQKEAIALLQDEKEKKDFTSRLKLYESKTPYRESD